MCRLQRCKESFLRKVRPNFNPDYRYQPRVSASMNRAAQTTADTGFEGKEEGHREDTFEDFKAAYL